MSAATSLPPQGPSLSNAMYGYVPGAQNGSVAGWGPAEPGNGNGNGNGRGPSGPSPPLAEIAASASEKVSAMRFEPVGSPAMR